MTYGIFWLQSCATTGCLITLVAWRADPDNMLYPTDADPKRGCNALRRRLGLRAKDFVYQTRLSVFPCVNYAMGNGGPQWYHG